MSAKTAAEYLARFSLADQILTLDQDTATVELAAAALKTIPDRIAKTLAFEAEDHCIMVVAAGERKVQNGKFKRTFGIKCRMCSPEKTLEYTTHAIGGVCPFGCGDKVEIYLDSSLKDHATVFPAAGDHNNAIELEPEKLYQITHAAGWVDICKEYPAK